MKKLLVCLLMFVMIFTLASCGGVNYKDYADKINAAVATDDTSDDYTYDQIVEDLGEGTGVLLLGTGALLWGDENGGLSVTFANNIAIAAAYAGKN